MPATRSRISTLPTHTSHLTLPHPKSRQLPTRRLHITLAICLSLFLIYTLFDPLPLISTTLCTHTSPQSPTPFPPQNTAILDRSAHLATSARAHIHTRLDTLILVAGHAIYMGDTYAAQDMAREENWILEPFQKGQVATFMRHIKTGLDLAANHTQALLIFSGGQTRARAGPRTEALSYYQVAEKGLRWNAHPEISMRAMSEEYARDSFENVLFSLCRFRQVTGAYPAHVHVVSFEFKRARFVDVHRRALRYPRARFTFHGVDPTSGGMEGVAEGERAAMGPFGEDLYGCRGGLGRKRVKRNPFLRFHPYPQGCSEIAPLFAWCGRSVFRGDLPWDSIKNT